MVSQPSSPQLDLEVFLKELSMEIRMAIGMEDRVHTPTDKQNHGGELILLQSKRLQK